MTKRQTQQTPTTPETNAFASDKDLANRYGICRQTWWRWVRTGNAPKPIKLTSNCTRWKMADIQAWEASREGVA